MITRTTDEGLAQREGSKLVSPHIIRPATADPFGWAFHAVELGDSMVAYHSYRSSVDIVASDPVDCYSLHLLLQGGMEFSSDLGVVSLPKPGSACVLSPTDQLRVRFAPGTRQLIVKVPTSTVEQAYGRLTGEGGGGRIVFGLRAPEGATWTETLKLAVQTIDSIDSGFPPPPNLGAELERLLVSSVLLAQPHTFSTKLGRPSEGRASRTASMVADAIQAAPELPVDFAELAQQNGVSLRTLQEGFRNRYGRSPSAFLRDARLDRAHQLLMESSSMTVTEAALASGFTHLGRFARDYRLRHGASPSATREAAGRRHGGPAMRSA
ncbi:MULTISPECIES: AraC family transcriptional regulator [Rhodococcus]|uniref:AraC family transcriptional regulator n=1 Tax=Rhodococcus TaxID=1827 RepID=UPI001ED92E46|nr:MULTISPECIES: AraC family transcriptional regulator [Rhodococcus]